MCYSTPAKLILSIVTPERGAGKNLWELPIQRESMRPLCSGPKRGENGITKAQSLMPLQIYLRVKSARGEGIPDALDGGHLRGSPHIDAAFLGQRRRPVIGLHQNTLKLAIDFISIPEEFL